MSTLRVNKIVNQLDSAGPQFPDGLTVSNGLTGDVTYNSAGGTITAGTLSATGDVSVSGTLTANSLSGNGAALTNVPGLPTGKAVALTFIS
tara:strand:+ start:134 stop:406 length:273 start_codon:yes stop_codon:yes gene_type:complete